MTVLSSEKGTAPSGSLRTVRRFVSAAVKSAALRCINHHIDAVAAKGMMHFSVRVLWTWTWTQANYMVEDGAIKLIKVRTCSKPAGLQTKGLNRSRVRLLLNILVRLVASCQ